MIFKFDNVPLTITLYSRKGAPRIKSSGYHKRLLRRVLNHARAGDEVDYEEFLSEDGKWYARGSVRSPCRCETCGGLG